MNELGNYSVGPLTLNIYRKAIMGLETWCASQNYMRAKNGWDKLVPAQPAKPIPENLLLLLAGKFIIDGNLQMGMLLIINFYMYLRIMEGLSLNVNDLVLEIENRQRQQPFIELKKTKTGSNQSVIIRNTLAREMMEFYKEYVKMKGGGRLFPNMNYARFRENLRAILIEVGLPEDFVTSHSLRRGGATNDFLLGKDVNLIQRDGRWKSFDKYIDVARVRMNEVKVPDDLLRRMRM
eukprot:Pgem_evm1s1559